MATATTNGGKKRANHAPARDVREDYGRHVGRTLKILKRLAKSPATSEELAKECRTSVRTITRFMGALGRETPVYARRPPGQGVQRWALDVEKFIAEFTAAAHTPPPITKRNGG